MGDMYDDDDRNAADDLGDTGRDAIDGVKKAKDTADKIKDLSSSAKNGGVDAGTQASNAASNVSGAATNVAETSGAVSGGATAGGSAAGSGIAATTGGGTAAATTAATTSATTTAATTAAANATATASASAAAAGAAAGGTAAAGGAVAAGAAAGGIGAVIVAAALVVKKVASSDLSSNDETGTGLLAAILLPIVTLIVIIVVVLAPALAILYQVLGIVDGLATQGWGYVWDSIDTYMVEQEERKFFERIYGEEWHDAATMTREFSAETVEVCKDIVDYSIQRAYDKYVWEIIFDLESYKHVLFDGYNPYETYKGFLNARHPYSTKYIKVQDYIDNYENIENDDLNYAEVFTILCQNEKFSYENFTYDNFFKQMVNRNTTKLIFELEIENENFYKYNKGGKSVLQQKKAEGNGNKNIDADLSGTLLTAEQVNEEFEKAGISDGEDEEEDEDDKISNPINTLYSWANSLWSNLMEVTDKVVKFFERWSKNFFFSYTVTLKPYGLEEMYAIADIRADAPNYANKTMRNIDMLDVQEALFRGILIDSDLGPAFDQARSTNSPVYNDLKEMLSVSRTNVNYGVYGGDSLVNYPTGRSAMCYVTNSLVLMEQQGMIGSQFWMSFPETTGDSELDFYTGEPDPGKRTVLLNFPTYIMQGYHGQGIQRGTAGHGTVADYGCIDCSFYMCGNYFWKGGLISSGYGNAIEDYLRECSVSVEYDTDGTYVTPGYIDCEGVAQGDGGRFVFGPYCWDNDMDLNWFRVSGADDSYQGPFYPNLVIEQLSKGNPVIFHLTGVWEYGGKNYHNSLYNHYLVIIGFDSNGFYVLDPGNQSISDATHAESNVIPYGAFEAASCKFIYVVEPLSDEYDYTGNFKINTEGE